MCCDDDVQVILQRIHVDWKIGQGKLQTFVELTMSNVLHYIEQLTYQLLRIVECIHDTSDNFEHVRAFSLYVMETCVIVWHSGLI